MGCKMMFEMMKTMLVEKAKWLQTQGQKVKDQDEQIRLLSSSKEMLELAVLLDKEKDYMIQDCQDQQSTMERRDERDEYIKEAVNNWKKNLKPFIESGIIQIHQREEEED